MISGLSTEREDEKKIKYHCEVTINLLSNLLGLPLKTQTPAYCLSYTLVFLIDDENLKILRTKLEFHSALKKYFLDRLNETVPCSRYFCPACTLQFSVRVLLFFLFFAHLCMHFSILYVEIFLYSSYYFSYQSYFFEIHYVACFCFSYGTSIKILHQTYCV